MPRSLSFAMILTLFAAFSAAAQSQDRGAPAPPAETKKPKKVWTNENLSGANGAVSVVGDPKNNPKPASSKPANAQYVASVRKQLDKLQGEIADIERQLLDLKNFSEGEPSTSASGVKLNKSEELQRRQTLDVREWHQTQQELRARAHRGPNARLCGTRRKTLSPKSTHSSTKPARKATRPASCAESRAPRGALPVLG